MENTLIKIAETDSDFEAARSLFEEYAQTLEFDLGYQNFNKELNEIAHQYTVPEGALVLSFVTVSDRLSARTAMKAVGCAGVRKFSDGVAELKRLYVQPEYRQLKLGKSILEAAIHAARNLGYTSIRLDTVPAQTKAHDLYRRLGFYEIEAYRYSPIEGTLYFEKKLKE